MGGLTSPVVNFSSLQFPILVRVVDSEDLGKPSLGGFLVPLAIEQDVRIDLRHLFSLVSKRMSESGLFEERITTQDQNGYGSPESIMNYWVKSDKGNSHAFIVKELEVNRFLA